MLEPPETPSSLSDPRVRTWSWTEKSNWKIRHIRIVDDKVDFHFRMNTHLATQSDLLKFLKEHEDVFTKAGYKEAILTANVTPFFNDKQVSYDTPYSLARQLPGIDMVVKNPKTGLQESLYSVIIRLNDGYKWSRDEIADWIETLDEVPVFEAPEEDQKECLVTLDGWEDKGRITLLAMRKRVFQVEYCRYFEYLEPLAKSKPGW